MNVLVLAKSFLRFRQGFDDIELLTYHSSTSRLRRSDEEQIESVHDRNGNFAKENGIIVLTDEAWFHFTGYVNSQTMRKSSLHGGKNWCLECFIWEKVN
jgi:hypothetical protein